MIYFDRYSNFKFNGGMNIVPNVKIPILGTDKQVLYKLGTSRLDKLSNLYYNNPYSGWLIMLANPQFGGLEFKIPDSTIIIIPYPFESALERYQSGLTKYKMLYG